LIGDVFRDFIAVIKSYVPDFSFGYLERLVPLFDISEGGIVTRTDLKKGIVCEIYPRAVSLLESQILQELQEKFEAYAKSGIEISFYSIVREGRLLDFEKFSSLYAGKGIFEEEAKLRKPVFENSIDRTFYVSFVSENEEVLKTLNLNDFPFKVKKKLNGDEVFTLYRNAFRDNGKYDLNSAILSTLSRQDYVSIRELIFPADIELFDDCIKIGSWYLVPVEIEAISSTTPDKMLYLLSSVKEAFYSMSLKYLSKIEVIELVEKKLRQVKGLGLSKTALYQKAILEALLSELKLKEYEPMNLYSFKSLVFARDREKATKEAEILKSRFGIVGFKPYFTTDLVKTMANTLPCMESPKNVVMFNDAVSSIPAYVRFIGYDRPLLVFEQGENDIVFFDPADEKSISWGIGIFGPTGMGKSNIANAILKALKSVDAWVCIMDIGDSYKEICNFFDGEYVKIDVDGKYKINPFQFRFGFTTIPEGQDLFVVKFLEIVLRHNFSPQEIAILRDYIKYLYNEKTLQSEYWKEYLTLLRQKYTPEIERQAYQYFSKSMPTLADFLEYFDLYLSRLDEAEIEVAKKLKLIFKNLSMCSLFNDYTNFSIATKDFTVFELKSLQSYPELLEGFYLILQKYINDEVYYATTDPETTPSSIISFYGEEELLKRWRRFKAFLTDEFHFVKNSRPIIDDTAFMYRTGRKKNLIRIVISQFLTDLTIFGQDVFDGIVENTAVIFLAPHRAETESGDKVKAYESAIIETSKLLHLTPEELKEFQSLRRTKEYAEYYLVSRVRGRTAVRYRNSPLERWIYATYTKDIIVRDTLIRKYGRDKAYQILLTKPYEELMKEVEGGITDA
jgi:hypothetical protein